MIDPLKANSYSSFSAWQPTSASCESLADSNKAEEERVKSASSLPFDSPKESFNLFESIGNFFKSCWNRIFGSTPIETAPEAHVEDIKEASVSAVFSKRPKLQAPEHVQQMQFEKLMAEMSKLSHKIKETNDDGQDHLNHQQKHPSEPLLFFLFVEAMKTQMKSKEEGGILAQERILKNQALKKELQKKTNDLLEEIGELSKTSNTLSWVGFGFNAAIALSFAASIVASIASAGAALPLAIGAVGGVSSIGQGVNSILKGQYDNKNNQKTGEHFAAKEGRMMRHKEMESDAHHMKDCFQSALHVWTLLRKIQENQYQASRMR